MKSQSRADTRQYLPAIVPPSNSGVRQLKGLALTPDGSKLIVANFADLSIAILDPDHPASGTVIPIPVTVGNSPGVADVVATSTGKVFVDGVSGTFSGCAGELFEVDLGTLAVTQRIDPALSLQLGGGQFSSTADGSSVLLSGSNCGANRWNASTDTFIHVRTVANDSAASGDGMWFASDQAFFDPQFIQRISAGVPEFFSNSFEVSPNGAIPGEKMNASGSLLYVPVLNGVDIFASAQGRWLGRILLKEQLFPPQMNSMALDEAGNRIFLITSAGLTVVQLGAPPLAIGYLNPTSGPAAGGTSVTIRGSGFQPGATVRFGDAAAVSTFVDSSTLDLVAPAGPAGATRLTVENPDRTSFSLDAAFVYQ